MYNTKKQLITVESRHCKGKNENRLKDFVNNKYNHVKGLNFNIGVTKYGYKSFVQHGNLFTKHVTVPYAAEHSHHLDLSLSEPYIDNHDYNFLRLYVRGSADFTH